MVRSLTPFFKEITSLEPVTSIDEPGRCRTSTRGMSGRARAGWRRVSARSIRARASQMPPEGEWTRWFLMAGRGFGKTKAGAEWVRHLAENEAGEPDRAGRADGGRRSQRDGRGRERDSGGQPAGFPPGVSAVAGADHLAERG